MMGGIATSGLLNFWLQIVIGLMLVVFCIGLFSFLFLVVVKSWFGDERRCFEFVLCVCVVDFEMILLQIWMHLSCDHGGLWLWVYLGCGIIFSWIYGL